MRCSDFGPLIDCCGDMLVRLSRSQAARAGSFSGHKLRLSKPTGTSPVSCRLGFVALRCAENLRPGCNVQVPYTMPNRFIASLFIVFSLITVAPVGKSGDHPPPLSLVNPNGIYNRIKNRINIRQPRMRIPPRLSETNGCWPT